MKVTRNEAKEIILNAIKTQSFEVVTLENAYNRVLYENIYAKYNIPESDKSAIDGFCFRIEDIKSYPAILKIIGESKAGDKDQKKVQANEAVFTMTGSIIPENADTAIRIEDAEINKDELIIKKAPKKGDLIDLAGSEIKKDEIILYQGEVLDYKKVSLLANLGFYQIKVYTRPSIGIIVTGNEIQEPWEQSYKAGVKNVNFYILKGMLEPFADIVYLGKVKDEPSIMNKLFASALKQNDILLSSAGASKGKYDFTKDIAKNIGLDTKFTMTNIRPGRPLIFGVKKEKLFFGLPGYPSALLINSYDFLLPAVKKIAGIKEYENKKITVIAEEIIKSKENRVDFVRVTLSYNNGKIFAKNTSSQQTSNFLSTSKSDALVIVDENQGSIKEGEVTEAILI
jgi:molybdopterin molybdotransferase